MLTVSGRVANQKIQELRGLRIQCSRKAVDGGHQDFAQLSQDGKLLRSKEVRHRFRCGVWNRDFELRLDSRWLHRLRRIERNAWSRIGGHAGSGRLPDGLLRE